MESLSNYKSTSGNLMPVFTIQIQTIPEDTDKLLNAILDVYPLSYGRYNRTASISAIGKETAQPQANSTTLKHSEGFKQGMIENLPNG